MSEPSHGPAQRIRAIGSTCIKGAFGPVSDKSRLDRNQVGAAGGILVLVAVGLPVAVDSVHKSVPLWVIVVSVVAGVIGAALIIKSAQRPTVLSEPQHPVPDQPGQSTGEAETDKAPGPQAARSSVIRIRKSQLNKSGVDITKDSEVDLDDVRLKKSPLNIRDRSQSNE